MATASVVSGDCADLHGVLRVCLVLSLLRHALCNLQELFDDSGVSRL